jgi:hypothetical protein
LRAIGFVVHIVTSLHDFIRPQPSPFPSVFSDANADLHNILFVIRWFLSGL